MVLSQDEPKAENQPIDLENKDLPVYDAVIPIISNSIFHMDYN